MNLFCQEESNIDKTNAVLPKNDENITIFVAVSLVHPMTEAKSIQPINNSHAQKNRCALSWICV